MSRFDPLFVSLLEAVAASEPLGDMFAEREDKWLDHGLPPSGENTDEGQLPCIRAVFLDSRNTRQREYRFAITFWVEGDTSTEAVDEFLALADELEAGMNRARNISLTGGYRYLPQPTRGLHSALWSVTYIAPL